MTNPVRPDEWEYYLPLTDADGRNIGNMLEFGDKINRSVTYKSYFESLGIRHTSIDWNGKNGALPLDLRTDLQRLLKPFDMVTNIGCTEHISDQTGAWKNVHNLTRPGGVLVSVTPYGDGLNWPLHGRYYPKESFFESFAELNGWEVERMGPGKAEPCKNLYARLVKRQHRKFSMPPIEEHFYINPNVDLPEGQ